MLMQQQLSLKKLPDFIEHPKTEKQGLMNGFLDERKCEWHGKVKFDLRESTDALWAIDDHHHATKALITTDQKFQSIESDRLLTCLEVLCLEH